MIANKIEEAWTDVSLSDLTGTLRSMASHQSFIFEDRIIFVGSFVVDIEVENDLFEVDLTIPEDLCELVIDFELCIPAE